MLFPLTTISFPSFYLSLYKSAASDTDLKCQSVLQQLLLLPRAKAQILTTVPKASRNPFFITPRTSSTNPLSQAIILSLLPACSSVNTADILLASHFSCGYSFYLEVPLQILGDHPPSLLQIFTETLIDLFKITTVPFPGTHTSILFCFFSSILDVLTQQSQASCFEDSVFEISSTC